MAQRLREIDPHDYDQTSFGHQVVDSGECHTVGCICGYLLLMNGWKLEPMSLDFEIVYVYVKDQVRYDVFEVAKAAGALLGLSRLEAAKLFCASGGNWPGKHRKDWHGTAPTAVDAAALLDDLADWKVWL